MKRILASVVALFFSATLAAATCTQFVAAGSGQNIVNNCNYAVIIEWVSSDGACSRGVRCAAVVGAGSWQSTSNPYYAAVNWWECVYDDWVNGYCRF